MSLDQSAVAANDRDRTAEFYKRHHAGETGFKRYGFTFGGEARARWFQSRTGTDRDILDIGCRDGALTQYFAPGNRVTGVDLDETALVEANRRLGIAVHSLNLNNQTLPFADESFDVVIAGEVLEHLQFPQDAVSEIGRVLRKGGRFLGSVPNAFRLKNRLKFLMGQDFENDPTHLHHFSEESLRTLLKDFREVEIDYLVTRQRFLPRHWVGSDMFWAVVKPT